VSGFWHGANWTFIAWGAYHALLFLPLILLGKNRKYTNMVAEGRILPKIKEVGHMLLTFFLAVIGWIIFRAESIGQAWEYVCGLIQLGTLRASYRFLTWSMMWPTNIYIIIMLVFEWQQRGKEHGFQIKTNNIFIIRNAYVRAIIYALLFLLFFVLGPENTAFIYFQF
jgi:hypothetical protein